MILAGETMGSSMNGSLTLNGDAKPRRDTKGVGDFGWGPWTIEDVLIPPNAGRGLVRDYYQQRTICQYLALSAGALWAFHKLDNTAYRAAVLGLLFPGAGFTAVATTPAIVAFLLTNVLLVLSIVVWFVLGGIFFPIAVWFGSAIVAGFLARDAIYGPSAWICGIFCYGGILYLKVNGHWSNAARCKKAQERNKWLIEAAREQMANATPRPSPESRELSLETLRHVQFVLERGLSPADDFSYHDVIDQFQSSSLRYQLYSLVDVLSIYQCHYAPNFHGYLSQASRNCIEKSVQKKVVSFWKWEAIFGQFNLRDWNPFKKDNIMVTGYLSSAMGLYGQTTGDRRYQEKDCLEFVVDESKRYRTDYQGLADALNHNMTNNPFTLYPCEPNWTFSICNIAGMAGLTISDRILGRDCALRLRSRFERAFTEEFTDLDGRILAIRSELTGFTLRSVCSTTFDTILAMMLPAYFPHIAHRSWAMLRKENLSYDENGQLQVLKLNQADMWDPGNYRFSDGPIYAFVAATAAEYGDEKIRQDALDQLDHVYFPVEATNTGSLRNKGLSSTSQHLALMGRLIKTSDLATASRQGPPQSALEGPLLAKAPFPDVLVAKAFSSNGKKLDLVLYNGKEAGTFELGFERLVPNQKYALSTGEIFTADSAGAASARVDISGRTQIIITPAGE